MDSKRCIVSLKRSALIPGLGWVPSTPNHSSKKGGWIDLYIFKVLDIDNCAQPSLETSFLYLLISHTFHKVKCQIDRLKNHFIASFKLSFDASKSSVLQTGPQFPEVTLVPQEILTVQNTLLPQMYSSGKLGCWISQGCSCTLINEIRVVFQISSFGERKCGEQQVSEVHCMPFSPENPTLR